jgi:MerR family mercuric resistance operon transcriptional regulator
MRESLSIGELARQTGSRVVTIRYYERIGLLSEPRRSPGGHRIYGRAHLDRLAFIRKGRDLGFSIEAIRSLLALSERPSGTPCAEIDHIAREHLGEVRSKIADLQELEGTLMDVLETCGGTTVDDCRVLDTLRDGSGTPPG